MSDMMPFPASWEDFLQEYSFKDKEQIYTNGSELIPVFRVEQMKEHYLVEKQVAEYWYQGYYKLLGELANYKWVSVKDRLPVEKINPITQDFELVICATTFGDVRAYGYGKVKGHDKAHFWHGAGIMDEYVTKWMPLPQKPESENDAE